MDEQNVKAIVDDVIRDLDLGGRAYVVETAMGGADENKIQIRFTEDNGDDKAVVVDLAGRDGEELGEDETRRRLRQQLETFAAISVAA
jgi:HSP20 family molecular chaperone IbpA